MHCDLRETANHQTMALQLHDSAVGLAYQVAGEG